MAETKHARVLIIGSGPAGYTAAVYGARAMLNPILLQGMQPGGQLTITTDVENWPGEASIMGPALMEKMEHHAREMGTEIVTAHVEALDLSHRPFTATCDSGDVYTADAVVLATGAQAKWLGLPSEEHFKGFGVSACATCDGFFYRGQEVVVIGGGNTAVEEALFLTNFAAKVTVIHRRDAFRAEKILQDRLFRNPKIEVVWDHDVVEVVGSDAPRGVDRRRARNLQTGETRDDPLQGLLRGDRSCAGLGARQGPARTAPRRLCRVQARLDRNLDARGLRGRRPDRPHLPAGRDQRGHGLHGGTRCGEVPGRGWRGRRPRHGRAAGLRSRGAVGRGGIGPGAPERQSSPRLRWTALLRNQCPRCDGFLRIWQQSVQS
jgi:thioredoxin reductase (NADPH)